MLLDTPRCTLSPLGEADADALHALWTVPAVRRYLFDDEVLPRETTTGIITKSAAMFAEHRFGLWGVRLRGTPALIGFAGFWYFRDPPELELLYGLSETHWGRGYAAEAAQAVVGYGFVELAMRAIRASMDAPNAASVRVIERLGFAPAGRRTIEGKDTMFFEKRRG